MTLPEDPWTPVSAPDDSGIWDDELGWIDTDVWTEDAVWSDE